MTYLHERIGVSAQLVRMESVNQNSTMYTEESFVLNSVADEALMNQVRELSEKIYRRGVPSEWIDKPFKTVTIKPQNNMQAKGLLVSSLEELRGK